MGAQIATGVGAMGVAARVGGKFAAKSAGKAVLKRAADGVDKMVGKQLQRYTNQAARKYSTSTFRARYVEAGDVWNTAVQRGNAIHKYVATKANSNPVLSRLGRFKTRGQKGVDWQYTRQSLGSRSYDVTTARQAAKNSLGKYRHKRYPGVRFVTY